MKRLLEIQPLGCSRLIENAILFSLENLRVRDDISESK